MLDLRNIPIQRKLRFVILTTCTAALCVASSALFAIQYFSFRKEYMRDVVSVSGIISGLSAPALDLNGPNTNGEHFLKGLSGKPHIVAALIRAADGRTISRYGPEWRDDHIPPSGKSGFQTLAGDLIYVQPMEIGGKPVGTLYLLTDYPTASIKLHGLYLTILVVVLASSFLVAIVVSFRLERVICRPIQALADTAHRITEQGDYSLRVRKECDDEVGEFTESFNSMLDQIQRRDAALNHEIAERTKAESELQGTQRQLMDASRQAGMAEVATGVLHNVGNVLNSVNVSATLIADRLADRRVENIGRAAELLREGGSNLAAYLAEDPKGRLLPGYLIEATEQFSKDRAFAMSELDLLLRNLEHIKDIVAMQQNYARVSGVIERLNAEELIEDAIRMNVGAMERHRVILERDFGPVPPISGDKHKVLQILVNLIRNAKYAIDEGSATERRITVRLGLRDESTIAIEVVDSGIGIPRENLTRIFSHGFTTRKDGHGFGLHSAALAAQQMGGRLLASSDGVGRGATFTLELPVAASHAVVENREITAEPVTVPA